MANYSERFNLKLDITNPLIIRIAADIGRGVDPDSGGAYSFAQDIIGWNGDTPIYGNTISTSTPCIPEFKETAMYLMSSPIALDYVMTKTYSERWADLTPPTFDECSAFIAAIIPEVPTSITI